MSVVTCVQMEFRAVLPCKIRTANATATTENHLSCWGERTYPTGCIPVMKFVHKSTIVPYYIHNNQQVCDLPRS